MTTSLTFSDLQSAIARLALDPRVSPSTPITTQGAGPNIWQIGIATHPLRIVIYMLP